MFHGHVKGYIQGEIDADIKGSFQGKMNASLETWVHGKQTNIDMLDGGGQDGGTSEDTVSPEGCGAAEAAGKGGDEE